MRAGARHRESWRLSERAEVAEMSGRGGPHLGIGHLVIDHLGIDHIVIDHLVNDHLVVDHLVNDDGAEKREEDYLKDISNMNNFLNNFQQVCTEGGGWRWRKT